MAHEPPTQAFAEQVAGGRGRGDEADPPGLLLSRPGHERALLGVLGQALGDDRSPPVHEVERHGDAEDPARGDHPAVDRPATDRGRRQRQHQTHGDHVDADDAQGVDAQGRGVGGAATTTGRVAGRDGVEQQDHGQADEDPPHDDPQQDELGELVEVAGQAQDDPQRQQQLQRPADAIEVPKPGERHHGPARHGAPPHQEVPKSTQEPGPAPPPPPQAQHDQQQLDHTPGHGKGRAPQELEQDVLIARQLERVKAQLDRDLVELALHLIEA